MSRLGRCFDVLKSDNQCALIPYITAGDPEPAVTVDLMHILVSAGADVIELGIPFSDPMADGPVIQAACERALKHHTSLSDVLDMVADFRSANTDTPVILMGYLNPIERMGYEEFTDRAVDADIDGVLMVDMPPEESDEFVRLLSSKNLDLVFSLAPTSTNSRISRIAAIGSGFLYYVSLTGVTGAGHLNIDEVAIKIDQIREQTNLPLGVGFGIKDAESAAMVAKLADAVIVGTALIRVLEAEQDDLIEAKRKISDLMKSMRESINTARSTRSIS